MSRLDQQFTVFLNRFKENYVKILKKLKVPNKTTLKYVAIIGTIIIATLAFNAPPSDMHKAFIRYKLFPTIREIHMKDPKTKEWVGGGTGFVVRTAFGGNVILTNSHICGIDEIYTLSLVTGEELKQVALDVIDDLCAVYPVYGGLTKDSALVVANKPLEIGERLYVAGHPRLQPTTLTTGEAYLTLQELVPIGYKEATENRAHIKCETLSGDLLLELLSGIFCLVNRTSQRITAKIMPGSSGSPVVNSWGEVEGVVWGYATDEAMGLAVPLNRIRSFLGYED